MKVQRVIAAAAVVALAGVGGMFVFVLAPEVHGQSRRDRDMGAVEREALVLGIQGPRSVITAIHGDSRIGVRVRDVEPADVTKHKLAGLNGAVILEVDTGTPAARAGLKAGDVVVTFDGERVRSASQLDRLVNETPPGRTVKATIVRDQAKLEMDVTPEVSLFGGATPRLRDDDSDSFSFKRDLDTGRMGDDIRESLRESLRNRNFRRFATPSFEFDWDGGDLPVLWGRGRLGVSAEAVSGQLATYFGVESGGVLVREVDENSAAAKAGVKAGDVITAVNGKPVRDAGELRRQIVDATDDGASATKEVTLSVTRDKKAITLKATIDDPQASRPRIRRVV